MADARRYAPLANPFRMRGGGELHGARLAYETWGELNVERDNALIIFTGLSPGAHAASSAMDDSEGWWESMVGPGKAIDTNRFFVICVNSLGSCHGSTGPASDNLDTGQPYRLAFPELSIEDIANSAIAVLDAEAVDKPVTVVGPSMGGLTALAFAINHPQRTGNLLLISCATHPTPLTTAIRSLQREMIRTDRDWAGGNYEEGHGPVVGMRLARKLGMISYRSAREWEERFHRDQIPKDQRDDDPFGVRFQVESYLEAHAKKFVGSFDANCYLYLSRAMDMFDVADYGGTDQAGLGHIKTPRALVIGVETDILFPLYQQVALAEGLREQGVPVVFHALPSIQGHDAFLVDIDRFGPAIHDFLRAQ